MEARACGNIDIQVRVVQAVKPPEYWHEVKHDNIRAKIISQFGRYGSIFIDHARS